MLQVKSKLKVRRAAYGVQVKGRLELPFAQRRKGHFDAQLASGEAVHVALPRGERLRGGDLVTASDGRVIEVVAHPEPLLQVEADPEGLARAAYHLGNLHVPVEAVGGCLRIAEDASVERSLAALGVKVSRVTAPFEPELVGGHGEHAHEAACDHDHEHHHHHGHGHHGHGHKH